MPSKESSLIDERLKFIARLLDGEQISAVCREFNISRETGYKLLRRYRASGLRGLTDRSRRPYRQANQIPIQIETLIVWLKRERPYWARRSASASSGFIPMCIAPPSARCTPCLTGEGQRLDNRAGTRYFQ